MPVFLPLPLGNLLRGAASLMAIVVDETVKERLAVLCPADPEN